MADNIEIDEHQIQRIFSYIEEELPKDISRRIFTQLGYECFIRFQSWINGIGQNIEKLMEDVNIKRLSPHWEKLEYGKDENEIILTGRKVDRCACPIASENQKSKSLCNYCCKTFQEEMFSIFTGKKVDVIITESKLLGGNRCSTKIIISND